MSYESQLEVVKIEADGRSDKFNVLHTKAPSVQVTLIDGAV